MLARIIENLEPMNKFDRPYRDLEEYFGLECADQYFPIGVDESVDERRAARRRLVSY